MAWLWEKGTDGNGFSGKAVNHNKVQVLLDFG